MMRKITQERFVFDLPVNGGTTIEFMDPDVREYMRRVFEDAERHRWMRSQNDWRYQTYPGSPWSCHWTSGLDSEQVDAAIDAAMKEGER